MFRLTQHMQELAGTREPHVARAGGRPGPVVIWNLTRSCNLACKHCYAISSDKPYPGELSTQQIFDVMDDLKAYRVPALILSGGEPLRRPDIWQISERTKSMKFFSALSTNGTMINETNIDQIEAMQYDYVGISLDGLRETHDHFRRMEGAFDASLHAIRLCLKRGIRVGIRFTLTEDNKHDFVPLLRLMHDEGIQKFYLSHLNYGGRGNVNREMDSYFQTTRDVLDVLYDVAWNDVRNGADREYVTGNNDADAVYFMMWAQAQGFDPNGRLQPMLQQWGGNASGVMVANIDNVGNVHPDTYWWHYTLGNVKQRKFSDIWSDRSDALMDGLKSSPRPLKGRCAACVHRAVCNGNTRVRAEMASGDPWQEDPGCYLTDAEIGLQGEVPRLSVMPFGARGNAVDRAWTRTLKFDEAAS